MQWSPPPAAAASSSLSCQGRDDDNTPGTREAQHGRGHAARDGGLIARLCPASDADALCDANTPSLSVAQLDSLSALAFALGSPLQRDEAMTALGMAQLDARGPAGQSHCDATRAEAMKVATVLSSSCAHPTLLIVYALLRRGVDPDRLVALIQSR